MSDPDDIDPSLDDMVIPQSLIDAMLEDNAPPCESCHGTGYYTHNNDSYKCGCWVSDASIARVMHKHLSNLASCLAIAGALCESWNLGHRACPCDQGPMGDEWYPGMGCTPESIKDRHWIEEPHDFLDDYGWCVECGNHADYYLHTQCPECSADTSDEGGGHAPDCPRVL